MRRLASGYGSGRNKTASVTLKIAVFAPIPRARVSTATATKPGLLRNSRDAKRISFIAKGRYWIDLSSAPGGNRACGERHRDQHSGNRNECERIGEAGSKQQTRKGA